METKARKEETKKSYEKPKITEEEVFEQKALACAPAPQSTTGQQINCSKPPRTPGAWWS